MVLHRLKTLLLPGGWLYEHTGQCGSPIFAMYHRYRLKRVYLNPAEVQSPLDPIGNNNIYKLAKQTFSFSQKSKSKKETNLLVSFKSSYHDQSREASPRVQERALITLFAISSFPKLTHTFLRLGTASITRPPTSRVWNWWASLHICSILPLLVWHKSSCAWNLWFRWPIGVTILPWLVGTWSRPNQIPRPLIWTLVFIRSSGNYISYKILLSFHSEVPSVRVSPWRLVTHTIKHIEKNTNFRRLNQQSRSLLLLHPWWSAETLRRVTRRGESKTSHPLILS